MLLVKGEPNNLRVESDKTNKPSGLHKVQDLSEVAFLNTSGIDSHFFSPDPALSVPAFEEKAKIAKGIIIEAAKWGIHSFNVKARLKEIRENLKGMREASDDAEKSPQAFRNLQSSLLTKLTLALGVSEGAAYLSAPVSNVLGQLITQDPKAALIPMIVSGYGFAIAAFDAAWYKMNRAHYRDSAPTLLGRVKNFAKDVLPLHAVACSTAIPFTYLSLRFSQGLIDNLHKLSGGLDRYIPSFTYSFAVFAFCEALPYMVVMAPFIKKASEKLAAERAMGMGEGAHSAQG